MGTWKRGMKHNWFLLDGEIRTPTHMTTEEFSEFLVDIEEKYDIQFLGIIKYSDTKDEDYDDK